MRSTNLNRLATKGLLGLVAITSLQTAQSAVQLVSAAPSTTTKTTTTASGVTLVSATGTTTTTTGAASSSLTLTSANFGNYQVPFASNSLWNMRPVAPVLDATFVVPKSTYYPLVAPGAYSTGVFLAASTDPAVVVYPTTTAGLWDPDSEVSKSSITIPHWPAATLPAAGSDGHADIVDPTTGKVHSFWQLRKDPTTLKWTAATYDWTAISGSGWGDPAHYMQGARAAGVPPTGGLIRAAEITDGKATYLHALALSLTYNALSANPTYVYPATSADTDAATTNSGKIPEGALVMLPASFDTSKIASVALKKVADTLKLYGAYVVDRNYGTPFYIYVENGTGYDLHNGGWNTAVAAELDLMRASLQVVKSTSGFLDNNGASVAAPTTAAVSAMTTAPIGTNLLSMRGPWVLQAGKVAGTFDSWSQSLIFPISTVAIQQVNWSGRSMPPISWGKPKPGDTLSLTVNATGGAKLRIQLRGVSTAAGATVLYDSGSLGDKQTARFTWPANSTGVFVYAFSGVNVASSVSGSITPTAAVAGASVPVTANVVAVPATTTITTTSK